MTIKEALLLNGGPVIKSVKEFGRIGLIAAVPLVINGLNEGKLDWRIIVVAVAIAVLKAIDKLLHEVGKESKTEGLITGLVRF